MACYGKSVGIIPRHGDQMLLIKRAKGPQAGTWAVPAGHMELGEFVDDTAVRELFEEVTIVVGRHQLGDSVFSAVQLADECSRGAAHHDWVLFEVRLATPDFTRDCGETQDARWVPLAELDGMNLEPVMRRMLGALGYVKSTGAGDVE